MAVLHCPRENSNKFSKRLECCPLADPRTLVKFARTGVLIHQKTFFRLNSCVPLRARVLKPMVVKIKAWVKIALLTSSVQHFALHRLHRYTGCTGNTGYNGYTGYTVTLITPFHRLHRYTGYTVTLVTPLHWLHRYTHYTVTPVTPLHWLHWLHRYCTLVTPLHRCTRRTGYTVSAYPRISVPA